MGGAQQALGAREAAIDDFLENPVAECGEHVPLDIANIRDT